MKKAWLFDVDGVLTNPEKKRVVYLEIFDQLASRLKKKDVVGLITGRSFEFIWHEIVLPLQNRIQDKEILKNLFIVAENGGVYATSDDSFEEKSVGKDLGIPVVLQNKIKALISEKQFSNIVFLDQTKKVMVTLELKPSKGISGFRDVQPVMIKRIRDVIVDLGLENVFKVSKTRIAIDIERKNHGKAFAARKFYELTQNAGFLPEKYICFGDSATDYEMFYELKRLGESVILVFVGESALLADKNLQDVVFTKKPLDEGTLEYLTDNL